MAHTPGPWTLNDGGTSIVVSGGPNNDDIADFSYSDEHTVSITREEALANARLLIAAPLMHALLERCVMAFFASVERDVDGFTPLIKELHAIKVILAKATVP